MRRGRSTQGARGGGAPTLLLVLLGVAVALALGGIFVALRAGRPLSVDLELFALDAGGAPVVAPVHVDGVYVGDTPLVLDDWWLADPVDLAPSADPWPPPPPAGSRPFSRAGLGSRDLKVETAPWTEPDGALVVPVRVLGEAGELRRAVRLEVGPPGARFTPTNSGGGTRQGLRSTAVTVRFGFTAK